MAYSVTLTGPDETTAELMKQLLACIYSDAEIKEGTWTKLTLPRKNERKIHRFRLEIDLTVTDEQLENANGIEFVMRDKPSGNA